MNGAFPRLALSSNNALAGGTGVNVRVEIWVKVGSGNVASGTVVGLVWIAVFVAAGSCGSRVEEAGACPWVQAPAINPNMTTRQAIKVLFKAAPVFRGGGWVPKFSVRSRRPELTMALYR